MLCTMSMTTEYWWSIKEYRQDMIAKASLREQTVVLEVPGVSKTHQRLVTDSNANLGIGNMQFQQRKMNSILTNFPANISGCSQLVLTLRPTPHAETTDLRTQRSSEVVSIMPEKRESSPEGVFLYGNL